MLTKVLLLQLLLTITLHPVECARILGVFPYPSKSHMTVFSSLTKALARRGHELVVVSPYPLSKPMSNYTDIDVLSVMKPLHDAVFNAEVYEFSSFPLHLIPPSFWEEGLAVTELLFSHPEVLELLNDKRGFDLVIAEAFISEAIYAFAHHFNTPLILISSMNGMHWVNYVVGTPFPLSCSPNPMLTFTEHMTFSERALNFFFTSVWDLTNQFFYFPHQDAIIKKVFGFGAPTVWELEQATSLVFLNTHLSLNYPRPLVPAMVEIGGMHIDRTVSKLPADLQDFLDGATNGAIYFSMGSNLRGDQMPPERRQAFLDAFSALPQRVLWKWESDSLPGQPSNVKLGKWLPQQEILAHPNVRVFITHGGLLSLQEAAFHGVALVGIPVFGDQMLNVRKAEMGGYAVMVTLKNVTTESVLWALDKTLHDPNIQREAKRRSGVFIDQIQNPLDRAVFWTEYVIRHNGAPHLRSAATQLSWYQLYLLDVAAAILGVLILSFITLKTMIKMCCGTSNTTNKAVRQKKRQ